MAKSYSISLSVFSKQQRPSSNKVSMRVSVKIANSFMLVSKAWWLHKICVTCWKLRLQL